MIVKTASGFDVHDSLPDGYRLATLTDFTLKGFRRIGMEFLVQWISNPSIYEINTVSNNLTSVMLKPWIEANRVFIKDKSI